VPKTFSALLTGSLAFTTTIRLGNPIPARTDPRTTDLLTMNPGTRADLKAADLPESRAAVQT